MKPLIRLFFRTLRILLGPVMLLKERLARPAPIQRAAEQQAQVDREAAGLALYQFKTCPFCIKVRQEIHALALPITLQDAQGDGQNRNALLQGSGATKVPCLRITDANGQVQWLSESGAIIGYLRARFAA
ncbi:glutathione S-transferase N-terminal domain-containing protein [Roseateles oligotrophus]|uniref:Glutathione S-transferase N-terminal domain-containing protein n=1 Tax=Roseateles oligotrophus TaxID=1769250 RepID=A0ABT2YJ69_9BURK|nr:glutathione S-transferase N-terminal domain-containing protein [Roseateles oligotrophus]MCV2370121.1 glutathione S-transferase N-terminal domain-containing protein [Roseateles oligotrophus]